MQLRWVIEYVDGSTFSNEDGDPQDAPGGGVAAIAQEDDWVGYLVHQGTPYYLFAEEYGGWAGADSAGHAQYCMRPGLKIIKLGETMSTNRWKALIERLNRDPRLPRKSARYPWEVRA
jgi:hypothetical protein